MLLWSTQAVLLGYLGGVAFAHQPLLGIAVGCAAAMVVLLATSTMHRRTVRRDQSGDPVRSTAAPAMPGPGSVTVVPPGRR